jgi:hypothetical protein
MLAASVGRGQEDVIGGGHLCASSRIPLISFSIKSKLHSSSTKCGAQLRFSHHADVIRFKIFRGSSSRYDVGEPTHIEVYDTLVEFTNA